VAARQMGPEHPSIFIFKVAKQVHYRSEPHHRHI